MGRPSVLVKLYHNPWQPALPDEELLRILSSAAEVVSAEAERAFEAVKGSNSFAAVILDPTRPLSAAPLAERVLASIEIGPDAPRHLVIAAGNANIHWQHKVQASVLRTHNSHLLRGTDPISGDSAKLFDTFAGGSGLSESFDPILARIFMEAVIRDIHIELDPQVEHGGDWLSPGDEPATEYASIMSLKYQMP